MTGILITDMSTCIKNIYTTIYSKNSKIQNPHFNQRQEKYLQHRCPYHKLTKNGNEEKFQKGTDVCVYCINKTMLGD